MNYITFIVSSFDVTEVFSSHPLTITHEAQVVQVLFKHQLNPGNETNALLLSSVRQHLPMFLYFIISTDGVQSHFLKLGL